MILSRQYKRCSRRIGRFKAKISSEVLASCVGRPGRQTKWCIQRSQEELEGINQCSLCAHNVQRSRQLHNNCIVSEEKGHNKGLLAGCCVKQS